MSIYPTYDELLVYTRKLVEQYRSNKVETPIDSGSGNILVTGRANSGAEDFETIIIAHLEETNAPYIVCDLDAGDSLEEVISTVSVPGYTVIVKDVAQKLFNQKSFIAPKNLIYFTRHWDKRSNDKDYAIFDHHIAFAALRNQDISSYTGAYSAIGSDLSPGEYISVDTGQFSAIDVTRFMNKIAA